MLVRITLVFACLVFAVQAKQYHLDEQAATVRMHMSACLLAGVPLGWRTAELVAPHLPTRQGCWFFDVDTGIVSVVWVDGSMLRLPVLRVRE